MVRNYALRLSQTGFFTECAGPNASSGKKNQFLGPMRKSYLFNECLNPTYFRRRFFPWSGVFLSVVRLGALIKPRILRRNDGEVSKLRYSCQKQGKGNLACTGRTLATLIPRLSCLQVVADGSSHLISTLIVSNSGLKPLSL